MSAPKAAQTVNRLFVARLPWSTRNDTLKAFFSKFGNVTESVVMMDQDTGRSRGFGFVTFEQRSDLEKVLKEAEELELDGRKITVNEAIPKERKPKTTEKKGFFGS
eukprot:comp12100_c0_seq1/m.6834 comp12100_c0_seq1/g.6834  ORF comp12100_c0_seq1/g.6834 comp12100_c0_seq1/m.6834 type:complete len:106 (-) comp12100_c0_seq1:425-742(-)